MNTEDLIRHMCAKSGKSLRAVSVKINKSPNYISSIFGKDATPNVNTLAEIANACGYVLCAKGHGETVALEPARAHKSGSETI